MAKTKSAPLKVAPEAPEPRKRFSGPSGKPGVHRQAQRLLRAPQSVFDLLDRAIEHNAESKDTGGYSGFSDWARHILVIAAADELGIDPLDALQSVQR